MDRRVSKKQQDILYLLALDSKLSMTVKSIAEKLDRAEANVFKTCQILVSRGHLKEIQPKVYCLASEADADQIGDKLTVEMGKEDGRLVSLSPRIKTVEDALAKAEVDTEVWDVDRFLVNSWEMGAKLDTGEIAVCPLWQVKVWLKRKAAHPVAEIFEQFGQQLLESGPDISPSILKHKDATAWDPWLLEISLFDNHFGMLAWGPECGGKSQDIKIMEHLYSSAVDYLLAGIEDSEVDKILFPVGSDFFHINDTQFVTPQNRNQLDVDSRLAKIFSAGCMAVINAVEKCRQIAPTEIVFVPGNHDSETSYFLCKYLEAWYRTCRDVAVDTGPAPRKFIRYGVNLIGLTHGSDEPWRDLPTIMATEVPSHWAETQHREWHVGHQHKRKQTQWLSTDTYGSVTVRMLPSLSRLDAWHYKKGYCSPKAAEAYIWSRDNGYVGHLSAPTAVLESM